MNREEIQPGGEFFFQNLYTLVFYCIEAGKGCLFALSIVRYVR